MESKHIDLFQNEVNVLKELDHPSMIKCNEFFEDNKRFMLVLELCQGGELFSYLQEKKNLDYAETAFIMKQLISSVNHMHNKGIVHRDLKLENVMLEDNFTNNPSIKLIDFGTAKFLNSIDEKIYEKVGTYAYMAPEVMLAKKEDNEEDDKYYTVKCDMFSIGVMAYTLLEGKMPFVSEEENPSKNELEVKK